MLLAFAFRLYQLQSRSPGGSTHRVRNGERRNADVAQQFVYDGLRVRHFRPVNNRRISVPNSSTGWNRTSLECIEFVFEASINVIVVQQDVDEGIDEVGRRRHAAEDQVSERSFDVFLGEAVFFVGVAMCIHEVHQRPYQRIVAGICRQQARDVIFCRFSSIERRVNSVNYIFKKPSSSSVLTCSAYLQRDQHNV